MTTSAFATPGPSCPSVEQLVETSVSQVLQAWNGTEGSQWLHQPPTHNSNACLQMLLWDWELGESTIGVLTWTIWGAVIEWVQWLKALRGVAKSGLAETTKYRLLRTIGVLGIECYGQSGCWELNATDICSASCKIQGWSHTINNTMQKFNIIQSLGTLGTLWHRPLVRWQTWGKLKDF